MLRMIAAFLIANAGAASAAPTTYTFFGLAERSPNGHGQKPSFYGQRVKIVLVLDPATPPTSVNGNTATYSYNCTAYPAPPPGPIMSAFLDSDQIGPGCFETVTVTSNPTGQSSIVIGAENEQVGGFTLSFVTTSPTAVPNVSIPSKIETLSFGSATFSVAEGDLFVEGDMATK